MLNISKRIIKQIGAFFIPIKGGGLVGLYQRTIVISSWLLIFSIVMSIVFEWKGTASAWLQLMKNYSLGVACSTLVVIVSAVIQYHSEHQKQRGLMKKAMLTLMYLLDKSREEAVISDLSTIKVLKAFDDFQDCAFDLFWFRSNCEERYLKIIRNTTIIWMAVFQKHHKHQSVSKDDIDFQLVEECISEAAILFCNDFPRDINFFIYLKEYR